jgi:hypothetical protein
MSQPAFPPNITAALDRLTVPPLPEGFSDRLLARLAAGDMPLESVTAPKLPEPRQRRILGGRWRRSGFVVGSVGLLGLATATAAAAGIFGEPIYLPVVSEALAKADLVENPKEKAAAKTDTKPKKAVSKPSPKAEPVAPTGKDAVKAAYAQLQASPEFAALPPKERMRTARREIAKLVSTGAATQDDVKAAWNEIVATLPPRQRERIEVAQQRREARKAGATDTRAPATRRHQRPHPTPEQKAARRETIRQMPDSDRARIRELRTQLRTASPSERPALRRELREIWARNAGADEGVAADPKT